MPDSTVTVVIVGQNRLGSAVNGASNSLNKLASRMQTVGSAMTRYVSLPIIAGFALAAREANEAMKVMGQTRAVLASTGGVANVTAEEVTNLANSISRKTGIDDEQIQSAENMLLTFTKVRNEAGKGNDIFTQATKIVTDMGAVFGDTQAQAIRVGKALQDPINGITALRRVGVNLDDQMKAQIQTMMKSGDLMGAQKLIMKELRTEFEGAAEAMATPWDKFMNKLRETGEQVGMKLMPALTQLGDIIVGLADAFLSLPDWAQTFVIGAAAVTSAVGPLLQFGAAMLRVHAATVANSVASTGAAGGMSKMGGVMAILATAAVGVAIGLEKASNEAFTFALSARDVEEASMTGLKGVTALAYADGTLADMIRQVAQESPKMGRKLIEAAKMAGASGADLKRYDNIVDKAASSSRALDTAARAAASGISVLQQAGLDLIDQELSLEGANLALQSAVEQYRTTMSDATSTELQRNEALYAAKRAVEGEVQAVLTSDMTHQQQIGTLRFLQGLYPELSGIIQQYIDKLNAIPPVKNTKIIADIAEAVSNLDQFLFLFNQLPSEKRIDIILNVPGAGSLAALEREG